MLTTLVRGLAQQHAADLGRAGEGELAHPRVVQHRRDDGAGAAGWHTLTTPGGTPASSRIAAIASAVSGVSLAGLSTTVQPAASAGPILRVAIAAGKFHGVTSTQTPTGWRETMMRLRPDGAVASAPRCRTASSAYQRKNSAA